MPMRPGMEGIVNKVTGYGKRKAVMKRKPGMAVMIAIGASPKHMGKPMHGEEDAAAEQEQEYTAKDKAAKDTVECPECGCKIDTKTGEPVEAESEDEGEAEDEEED